METRGPPSTLRSRKFPEGENQYVQSTTLHGGARAVCGVCVARRWRGPGGRGARVFLFLQSLHFKRHVLFSLPYPNSLLPLPSPRGQLHDMRNQGGARLRARRGPRRHRAPRPAVRKQGPGARAWTFLEKEGKKEEERGTKRVQSCKKERKCRAEGVTPFLLVLRGSLPT